MFKGVKIGATMYLYHGTSKEFVNDLTSGKIDITKGGGEFGQGFYVGNNLHLVSAWAWQKFQENMSIVEYEINDSSLPTLRILILSKTQAKAIRYKLVKKRRKRQLYFKDNDLVIGPVVGRPFSDYSQFVFVSKDGECYINEQKPKELWR